MDQLPGWAPWQLFFLMVLTAAGCSEDALSDFGNTLGGLYEAYGPGHLHFSEDHAYYAYRYDMHHEAYEGVPAVDINDGLPLFGRFEMLDAVPGQAPVYDSLHTGTYSVTACLQGSSLYTGDPGDGTILFPDGYSEDAYIGAVDGGRLWRKLLLLPEDLGGDYSLDNMFSCTVYAWAAGLSELYDTVHDYLERYPDHRVLLRVTAVKPGLQGIPDGYLFEAASCDDDLLSVCRYVYNVQPGIGIDYGTGESWLLAAGRPDDDADGGEAPGEEADGIDGQEKK